MKASVVLRLLIAAMAPRAVRCAANNSVAIRAKQTCRERSAHLAKMTRSGHQGHALAAMHGPDLLY